MFHSALLTHKAYSWFSSRPRDNLRKTERAALKTLKDNTNLSILPADKGNATAVLNTSDYKQKISSLLEDPAYRKWPRIPRMQ